MLNLLSSRVRQRDRMEVVAGMEGSFRKLAGEGSERLNLEGRQERNSQWKNNGIHKPLYRHTSFFSLGQCTMPGLAYAELVWSFLQHSLPQLINAVCTGGNHPL